MEFIYKLSNKVSDFIKDANLEEISIGCSDSQVVKIEKDNKLYFLKIANLGLLTSEYEKLEWMDGKLNVPKVVLYDTSDSVEYLITEGIPGEMVCSDYYRNNQEEGIKIIADAFKQILSVDISNCPFDVSIDYKIGLVKRNVDEHLIDNDYVKEETLKKYGSLDNIVKFLEDNKFYEEPCFSHGDTSLPNIFADNSKFSGFIDVGECGIADKWFDLAICEKSIIRNYGKEYVDLFYKELDIIPDRDKINYYLLMMELYL